MGFRAALAQILVFACGVLAWMAATRGLPMTTVLCVAGALFASGVSLNLRPAARPEPAARLAAALIDRQRLLALLDLAPTPMVLRDRGPLFVAVNRAARDLFHTDGVIAPTDALTEAFDRRQPDQSLQLDGANFSVALADIAASDDAEEPQRLGVLTDMTAEVRAAQASALRDVLQILNHELMNSLTPITSLAETAVDLLADDTKEAREGASQAIALVAARTAQLLHFAESYRALAKLPPPKRQNIRAGLWAGQIAQLAHARSDGTKPNLELAVEDEAATLFIDPEQMTQALINLLTNAFEACLAEGSTPHVRFAIAREDGSTVLTVEDNGPGVPDSLLDSVFLPFFTTKPTGSGVGLALVRQIVVNHGGEIRVERSAGLGGARFRIAL